MINYYQFIGGIVTGIIASIITAFCSKIIYPSIWSHIGERLYRGPILTGSWDAFYTELGIQDPIGKSELCQKGYKVTGKIFLTKNQYNENINRTYLYSGTFSSGKLVLQYEDVESRGVYLGSLVMHIEPDNNTLNGKAFYYCHKQDDVIYTSATFKRN